MIVYGKREETVKTRLVLKSIEEAVSALSAGGEPSHEKATEVLIEWGAFESAVTDALFPDEDSCSPLTRALRCAGLLTGHLFLGTLEKDAGGAGGSAGHVRNSALRLSFALEEVSALTLPEEIIMREPEGYAHYGLFPETYAEAAKRFIEEVRPERAVCIGLRSIGTSLSSVVAALLEAGGCEAMTLSLRPRGHPFNRRTVVSAGLARHISGLRDGYFLVIDEGPGLSGTSFGSVAAMLKEAGAQDDRIIFFPSWSPDGGSFISDEAGRVWKRHVKYTVAFEELLKESEGLKNALGEGLVDISAGMWRERVYGDEDEYPAVHPRHEKRKYLSCGPDGVLLARFAGLGKYGELKYRRALRLSEAGFIQPVKGIKKGFLFVRFVEGRPLDKNGASDGLVDFAARYAAFLSLNFRAGKASFDPLAVMIRRNVRVGLGKKWALRLGFLEDYRATPGESVELDGRMLPHEFLETPYGYIKADAFDHHRDQFFPCRRDIAWDIAGFIAEFSLPDDKKERLLEKYLSATGDSAITGRLGLYTLAYLSYRLGYAAFASNELPGSPDGLRFKALRDGYAAGVKKEIERLENATYKKI